MDAECGTVWTAGRDKALVVFTYGGIAPHRRQMLGTNAGVDPLPGSKGGWRKSKRVRRKTTDN
jgi:hypothetical protein